MKRAAFAASAFVIALVLLAVLLGPALVDTPAVRTEIQQRLSRALQGKVTWASLELALLPAPHGELRQLRVEIPGRVVAAAENVDVHLRLWPLLRGRAEISSFTLRKPSIRVSPGTEEGGVAPADPLATYRAVMDPVVRALRELAPQTVLRIEGGAFDPGAVRELDMEARTGADGVDFQLAAASARWKRGSIKGNLAYADLAAHARIEIDALHLDGDLPPANVRAELRTDGRTSIESDFEGSLGTLAAARGKARLPANELEADVSGVDLAQALAIARRKVPGLGAVESAEGKVAAKLSASLGPPWRAQVALAKSDAAVKVAQLPWKLSVHEARIALAPDQVRVDGLRGAIAESSFSHLALQLDLGAPMRVSAASGRATLKLEQWLPWLQAQFPLDEVTALSGLLDVTLNRLALRLDRPAEADFEVRAAPRGVSVGLKALPAMVRVTSGSLRVDPAATRLEKVAVGMMDARALVSGTVATKGPKIELALSEGAMGGQAVRWALERGKLPERLEPKTPLRFAARRVAWQGGALEADAQIDFDGGPQLGVTLAWTPKLLELRRLAVKDGVSDAVLGAKLAGNQIEASFSGTLEGRSIAALLRHPVSPSGTARGKLRVTVDRARPSRTFAEGRLQVDALDLTWLAGQRAIVEHVALDAGRELLRITEARLDWEEQRVRLRGEMRRTGKGPVIEAELDSPGLDLERLLPPAATDSAASLDESALWPLPVSGRIDVRSEFLQYRHHRIAPLEGSLALEPHRAHLTVKEARMCGVAFPLEVTVDPKETLAAARISMQKQPLDTVARCLTGDTVDVTGRVDLRADLRTHGKPPHMLRNLTGTAQLEVRDGTIKRFGVIGNILSLRNLASVTELKKEGVPYRRVTARGQFQEGHFMLEEGFFDSNTVRLAATGRIDMLGADSRLTVLVAPLTTVDRVVGAVPILGHVLGGTMTGLPVAVNGDIRNPTVVPLGPRAITESLLGIFERALELPGKLVVPPEAK